MTDTSTASGTSSESGTGDAAAQQAAADAAAQQAAADAANKPTGDADSGDSGDNASPWDDPAKAKTEIERLRRENGDARVNAKKAAADDARKELLQTLTAALDPAAAAANNALTLEQVTETLTKVETERNEARDDAALVRAAWAAGLDPSKLDYLAFTLGRNAEYAALDSADGEYAAKLSAVISSEIAKDSSLRGSGTPSSTSVDQHGGAGGASTITQNEFAKMSYGQRVELYNTNRAEYDRLAAS